MAAPCRFWERRDAMPITSTQIANYSADVVSPGGPNQFAATIRLFRADGSMLASARFYRAGTTMAPNEFRSDLNAAVVSFRYDAFAPMVDLLRNETPVYFTWFDYSAQVPGRIFGMVGTSREPVGEAE
jgi:hypothetical protein